MLTQATVTQASPLLVRLDGSTSAVPSLRVSAYTPVLADRVAVDRIGSQILVLGKVI